MGVHWGEGRRGREGRRERKGRRRREGRRGREVASRVSDKNDVCVHKTTW